MQLHLAYPPDPDSTFAFHGLASGKVDRRGHNLKIEVADLASLNNLACQSKFEATILSSYGYSLAWQDYAISAAGGIFGHGTGPVIVSAEPMDVEQVRQLTVATAATTTTAYLAYSLLSPALRSMVLPGDKLIAAVQTALVPFALIAHTHRMTAMQPGLSVVIDLGKWWCSKNAPHPMPLHLMGIRRDLPENVQTDLVAMVRDSVRYGLANPGEALKSAAQYSAIDDARLRDHVLGCVTEMSIDMGPAGLDAIKTLLDQGDENCILIAPDSLDLIE